MKRIIGFSIIICMCCMIFSGCQRKGTELSGTAGETGRDEASDVAYVPSYSITGFEGSVDIGMYSLFLQGDYLYQTGADSVTAIDLATGERTETEINGYSWKRTGNGFASISSMAKKIYVYDDGFEQTGEIDLAAYGAAVGGSVGYSDFTVDTQGHAAVLCENTVHVLDTGGEYLFCLKTADGISYLSRVFSAKDGNMYILAFDRAGQAAVYPIDLAGQRFGEKLADIPDISSSAVICPANEEEIYFAESELYRYNTRTQSCTMLCVLTDYGIFTDPFYDACGVMADGTFGMIDVESPSYGGARKLTNELELVRIEARNVQEVQERTELILAVMEAPVGAMLQPILDFNKYNPDYYITIREYADEVDPYSGNYRQEYELAVQRLNNDLVSGKMADIFFVDSWRGIDVINLTGKGVVADLYQLMDGDEEIGREDFIPNILSAMEYDGKLCLAAPYFEIYTLAGKEEYLAEYDRLDYGTLKELTEKHPEAALVEGEPVEVFETIIPYYLEEFYDGETGECSFDSREFVSLLEFAASIPAVPVSDSFAGSIEKLRSGEVLLNVGTISSQYDIQTMTVYFGEEVSCIGYPVPEGSGSRIVFPYYLAISELSEHKEGAWELVKGYLSDETQEALSYSYGIPVIQEWCDSWIEYGMENDGSLQVFANSDVGSFEEKALSGEEAEQLRNLIASATATSRYDTVIYNIVMEEVQSFFAGSKTAEEAAGIIQSRVRLYLDEQGE